MADPFDKVITDLARRMSNSVMIGTVMKDPNHEKGRYRVKIGDLETDWLPKTEPRAGKTAMYSSYEEGEQVIIASPSGDLSQAVIVGAVATGKTQAGDKGNTHVIKYPDGTTVTYDHDAHTYKMAVASGGSFELSIGGGVTLSATGGKLEINAPGGAVLKAPSFDVNP